MGVNLVAGFFSFILLATHVHAACYDPAIEAGFAARDPLTESLAITLRNPPVGEAKYGDTVVGIGVKGRFFGCKITQASIAPAARNSKKFSLFLRLRNGPVEGFELDVSAESRRLLAVRAIQVPWAVVDDSQGPTVTCAPSTSTSFEGFLYRALRLAKSRRCTELEIEAIVGKAAPARKVKSTPQRK